MRVLTSGSAVRAAAATDVPVLIELMRALAAFEDYLDDFRVDEQSLLARAFGREVVGELRHYHRMSVSSILI
ncbi:MULTISPECIES: hypothetical protein [unclassified Pseudomonas]|uniref:hypothetical protein n=1 Tax=unclassified Pseudomonas TaxID=196821 RepID=UPI001781C2BF|nr:MULTISPECIES: hypothetical protein [unclassified Pseudomonas]MBD8593400.1 hypothetical protein [Pseudomonas sp. CFBP 8758]MBD8732559.1 hypothetical protein [Pseudomonas sp. CFBP 13710]